MDDFELDLSGFGDINTDYQSPASDQYGTGMPKETTVAGDFLRSLDYSALLNTGLGFLSQSQANKAQEETQQAILDAKRLELKLLEKKGQLSAEEHKRMLELQNATGGSTSNTNPIVMYSILGVVLVGALGTMVYFLTKKK